MRSLLGIVGFALLVILLISPSSSDAQWSGPETDSTYGDQRPTSGEAAQEATRQAFRDATDSAKETGESIKKAANLAYEATADAAKTVTGGRKDDSSTGLPGAAYRDAQGNYVEDTVSAARGRVSDAIGALKDAAPRASDSVTGGRKDAASARSPGAAYRDSAGKYVEDTASSIGSRTSDTMDAVKDAAARTSETIQNTARETIEMGKKTFNAAGEKASQAASATKDATVDSTNLVRDKADQAYDATAQVIGATSDKVSDSVGRTEERTWGAADSAGARGMYDAAGNHHQSAMNIAARSGETAKSHASYAGEKMSEAVDAATDAAQRAGQNVRDGAARAYDATTDTLGTPTKEKIWEGENTERRGVYSKAGGYYESAKDSLNAAGASMKDKAWGSPDDQAPGVYDKARDYYQSTKDSSKYAADQINDVASRATTTTEDTASRAGQTTKDSAANAYNSASEYMVSKPPFRGYGTQSHEAARVTTSAAFDGAKNKLERIMEIMGWHEVPHSERTSSSSYDVIVGNTKYVWHKESNSENSYYDSAKETIGKTSEKASQVAKDTIGTTSDKGSQVTTHLYDAAGRVKDRAVDTAHWATENVKDMTGRAEDSLRDTHRQTTKSVSDLTERGNEALGAGAAAVGLNKLGGVMESKGGIHSSLLRFLYLMSFAITFGSAVWMTFVSGALLSRSISREQFRNVQTKMFPYFLKFMTLGETALTVLYAALKHSSKWQLLSLVLLVASTCFNAFVLEPKTTKIYFEKLKLEKEEGRGYGAENFSGKFAEKNKEFNEVHGFSTMLNLLSLAGLTGHGWHMVSKLST